MRGGDSQQRSSAVHRPLRYDLRSLSPHRDSREFGDDPADGIGHFALGPDGHTHVRRDEHVNVTIAGGQDDYVGKIIRIGHLGYFGEFDIITTLSALEMTLAELGYEFSRGAGVIAAETVFMEG